MRRAPPLVAAILWLGIGPSLLPGPLSAEEQLQLSADRSSIDAGEQVTLSWAAPSADPLYLSHVGSVAASGTRSVSPPETTTYVLVLDDPAGVRAATTKVAVGGRKGDGEFPADQGRFKYPLVIKSKTPLVKLLDQVHRALQDQMKFSVREFQADGHQMVFLTSLSKRSELVKNGEDRIGARRISYLVEVDKEQGQTRLTIRALIEYQRRIESTWRTEDEEALYRESTSSLRGLLP